MEGNRCKAPITADDPQNPAAASIEAEANKT